MEKINKITLPATIIIASVILGAFFYATQISKQKSIEKQQQAELELKAEQDKRDYIAKRKADCLTVYKAESDKWNNVVGWSYVEPSEGSYSFFSDTCEIQYKDNSTGKYFNKNF